MAEDEEESLHRRGRADRRRGDLDRAVETFTHASQRFPQEARPLIQRAAVRVLAHRYHDALTDYLAADALNPSHPGLRSYFAEVYLYSAARIRMMAEPLPARPG
jgi:hypothetical protein